jgi:general secretion pathway protein G
LRRRCPLSFKNYHKDEGFTLIELLLVVMLIGILSGLTVSIMNYSGIRSKMRDGTRVSDLRTIQNALEQYFVDYREYPVREDWVDMPTIESKYLKKPPKDPLSGNSYKYKTSTSGSYYALMALMEVPTSNDGHECTGLNSFPTLQRAYAAGNDTYCYGVESPTVVTTP